jgi:hypothetical protein
VDHLELIVDKGELEQQRHLLVVKELLPVVQSGGHLPHGGRDEDGVRGVGAADPVLRRPEVASRLVLTSHAGHQLLVHLAHERQAQREAVVAEPRQPVLEGDDVVAHLTDVVEQLTVRFVAIAPGLEAEEVGHLGPRPLDARAEDCFQPNVGTHEEVWVGQEPAKSPQAIERARGAVELEERLVRAGDLSWERAGAERPITLRSSTYDASAAPFEAGRVHPREGTL